jgi:cobalt/nickel transport system ATP-binding protein
MSTPPLVELRRVCFAYPGPTENVTVLDRVDVRLDYGRRLGLIGPNGSGKTTLLHLIVGILRPTGGELLFKGSPVRDKKDYLQLRRSVGLVFQDADDQLFSPTVIEDVAFGPLNLGMSSAEALDISMQTLQRLGLTDLADRVTHQLSGGEKKLVSLATVLSMQPEAMLLDEPTNNLDTATRSRLIDIVNSLDIACLIISHDWDFLAETCRDLYALENGRAVKSDTACLHVHRHAHPFGDHPHKHEG